MKKRNAVMLFIIMILITALSGTSSAENRSGAVYINPHVGGYIFDDDQDITDDPLYGINLGVNVTENIGVEGVFDRVETDAKSSDSGVEALIYRLNFLYNFMPDNAFVPFIIGGGGAVDINTVAGDRDFDALLNYGVGFKYFVTKVMAVRADVQHIIDMEDVNNDNLAYTLGLTFQLGGKEKAPPPPGDSDGDGVNDDRDTCPDTPRGASVDSRGCPKDSDGDGVYDYLDKCKGTPKGAAVNNAGCPLDSDGDGVYDYQDNCKGTPKGTPVDGKGCPKDSDGDGVFDNRDQCPNTPKGAKVDQRGCPLDSDKDGVYDHLDSCPATPAGRAVDSRGCPIPIKETVSIELNVEFATNSPEVNSVYDVQIQKVIEFLRMYPETAAVIEGHTDSQGSAKYNLNLSQKRAQNVMKILVTKGVDPKRLKATGYGESSPIADNNTKEGRQKNRRVIAVISTVVTK